MIRIVEIADEYYFPMFKNGSTSIHFYADKNDCKYLFNEQCRRVKSIVVFIRHPKERFVSGVHSFIHFEKRKFKDLDYETVLYLIKNHGLKNMHFETQRKRLEVLHEFFDGDIVFKGMEDLTHVVGYHKRPSVPPISEHQKRAIENIIPDTINVDYDLFDRIGRKESIRNVLS